MTSVEEMADAEKQHKSAEETTSTGAEEKGSQGAEPETTEKEAADGGNENDDDEDEILGTGPSAVEVSKDEEDELLGPSADNKQQNSNSVVADSPAPTAATGGSDGQDESTANVLLKRKRLEEEGELDTGAGEKTKKSSVSSNVDAEEEGGEGDRLAKAEQPEKTTKTASQGAKDDDADMPETTDSKDAPSADAAGGDDDAGNEASADPPKSAANKGFDMFKASPFAALAGNNQSPFGAVASSGASPFATFAGTKSAFGQLASKNSSATTFGASSGIGDASKPSPFASLSSTSTPFGGAAASGETGKSEAMDGTTEETAKDGAASDDSKKVENGSVLMSDAVNDKKNVVFGGNNAQSTENSAEATEVITGEEGEECIFRIRARLYRLTVIAEDGGEDAAAPSGETSTADSAGAANKPAVKRAYREMGAGIVHINVPEASMSNDAPRLVMRREGVLKLLLNAVMWKTMPFQRATDKSVRFTCKSVVDDPEVGEAPETYLLKVSREDQCNEFFKALLKARDMCP